MKCLAEAVIGLSPANEYLLILPEAGPELRGMDSPNVERIVSHLPYYSVREQIELPRILRKHGVDVLHAPHFNMPLWSARPTVVTIHDVIYLAFPSDLPSPVGRLYYRAMMQAAVRRARRVLTDSEFSRQDIIRRLDCDPCIVEVAYPAVDQGFAPVSDRLQIQTVLARFGIDEEFVLYAGICKPRKNHEGLLEAFRQFLSNGGRGKLVLAGPLEEGQDRLAKAAARLGIRGRVIFTGFVSEKELPALYTAARVYACPSLYEGFGFTVLEAMACGAPVVCSRETSLPEVGGDAACYADPRAPQKFGEVIHSAFCDQGLRRQMIERGYANVRRFSWSSTAERALAAYEQAAEAPRQAAVFA